MCTIVEVPYTFKVLSRSHSLLVILIFFCFFSHYLFSTMAIIPYITDGIHNVYGIMFILSKNTTEKAIKCIFLI